MSRYSPPYDEKLSQRLLSTSEAAAYLNVSTTTLRNYLATGKIQAKRIGPKLIKYRIDELEKFMQSIDDAR